MHIILSAAVGLVSLLFTILAYFISRDFKSRDRREEEFLKTFTDHGERISTLEAEVATNKIRIETVGKHAHDALDIANFLKGKASA